MRVAKMELVDTLNVSTFEPTYHTQLTIEPSTNDEVLALEVYRKESKLLKYINAFIKRVIDIIGALVGIIFLIPITIIIGIANFVSGDKGPLFYSHERIGKNGKRFKLYKFRSMCVDADEKLQKLLRNDEAARKEWEENQKLHNDPRITKIGHIIRKTSIDEMPQFINVLKGDMSLIGPRPLVAGELDAHSGVHELYERVRPGITSWWACNGRSNIDYNDRLMLEYYYVKNANLWLDLKCVFRTIKVVISRNGAK